MRLQPEAEKWEGRGEGEITVLPFLLHSPPPWHELSDVTPQIPRQEVVSPLPSMSDAAAAAAADEPAAPAPALASGSSSEDHPPRASNHHDPAPPRKSRLPRACTTRPPAVAEAAEVERPSRRREREAQQQQCGRIITPLVDSSQPRFTLRSMWQFASVLSFLHIFRPLLNISTEFSADELETALLAPDSTLDDVHIPLLKAVPPISRMALRRATWVTVLCRKLKDWWHWVADGEIPIVASQGSEVETYKMLDPRTRVQILKALCDVRVEQEDIRGYIDNSVKHGIPLSVFRRERIGGDSYGVSYWYEDDPVIGHRLYREIRHVEGKKAKAKHISSAPLVSYQWETVATNLEEFQEVSDKLFESRNRTEVSLGKRLKIDILPEIEKIHKRKERVLKKQHRQALLLDSFMTADSLSTGRLLRDRKPVTYTFDDYDRSINEAIKITKKKLPSPEHVKRVVKPEASSNGKWNGSSEIQQVSYDEPSSPMSIDYEETDGEEGQPETLDRSDRQRRKPQRYSENDFVGAASDNDVDFDSDDEIVGEAVYDEEYLRNRKQRKATSSSEGDEEYKGEDYTEDEEEECYLSVSEESDGDWHKTSGRSRRETKLRPVNDLRSGPRRSSRRNRTCIDYRKYEVSESDADSSKTEKSIPSSDAMSDASAALEPSTASKDSQDEEESEGTKDHSNNNWDVSEQQEQLPPKEKLNSPREGQCSRTPRFLDLNELAPGTGFEDGPSTTVKDEDADNF